MRIDADSPLEVWIDGRQVTHAPPPVVKLPATPAESTAPRRIGPIALDDRRLSARLRIVLAAADMLAVVVSVVAGARAIQVLDPIRAGALGKNQIILTVFAIGIALHLHGLYRWHATRLRPSAWWRSTVVARCVPTGAMIALGIDALIGVRHITLSAALCMVAPIVLTVPLARRIAVGLRAPAPVTRIIVVGNGQVADRVTRRLNRCSDTMVVGLVDDDPIDPEGVLGRLAELPDLCREHKVDRVVVAFSRTTSGDLLKRLRELEGRIPISVVPRFFELHSWRSQVEELHGIPVIHIPPAQLGSGARIVKRLMDVLVSSLALSVLVIPGMITAAAIKLDSAGPVFFRQERRGRGGTIFRIYKFRTMTSGAEAQHAEVFTAIQDDGPLFKMPADPRVTRLGSWLRRTSIDELPQLINVLRGDMSLVGPRPFTITESEGLDGPALARFDVAPGMTGLWQVSGRSDLNYADLQHLDSVYVRSWSLAWDLRIMLATPRSVFSGHGAY